MKRAQPAILLLDGHSLQTLAFTRSLGRAGVTVTVAAGSPKAPAGVSRHCARFLIYPSPLENPDSFRHWLGATLDQYDFDLLAGTTDQTLPLLYQWREELEPRVAMHLAEREAYSRAYDNAATIRLAQEQGLAVPQTFFIQDWEDLGRVAANLRGPVVIRPRASIGAHDGIRCRLNVEYAFDGDMLLEKYAAVHRSSPWPLVKEYVAGTGVGCFLLFHRGRVLARFQHRRIRETNPTGSGSCLRVSVAPDPALMAGSERLLRSMNWEGLAMVEYRVNEKGTAYLMEVNPRPWGSMQLAVESGVDFPLLWYRAVTGQPVEQAKSYRTGVYCGSLVGDLRHLESVLYGPPAPWPLPFPGRLRTLASFFKFWGGHPRCDEFAARDWRPGFLELRNYLVELGGRLSRLLHREIPIHLPGRLQGGPVK